MNTTEWLEHVKKCQFLPEKDMLQLLKFVSELLLEESTVQPVNSPVSICGDVHGQFYDVMELFRTGGDIPRTSYIFMGDYVDRGYYSLETITLLFLYKAMYPDKIVLLRGNHESRQITMMYGFYDECHQKYGNTNVWKQCMNAFDNLTLGALIDGSVFCVHGGISPEVTTLDQMRTIKRNQEIPLTGAFSDLVWSDPEEAVDTWAISSRGAGWLYGSTVTKQFANLNSVELICRSHQLVNEGFKYFFDEMLVTVWSAPNYCYRCGNLASILALDEQLRRQFKVFNAVPDEERKVPERATPLYFL